MKVEQLMSKEVLSCFACDTLDVPSRLMWEGDVGAVPVVDKDSGMLAGIITDRDIAMSAYLKGKPIFAIGVDEVMSKKVFSVKPSDTVASADELMRQKRIRRLPVVDGGKVVGMLSLNDIARESNRERGTRSREVPLDEVVGTFAAISEPRHHARAAQA